MCKNVGWNNVENSSSVLMMHFQSCKSHWSFLQGEWIQLTVSTKTCEEGFPNPNHALKELKWLQKKKPQYYGIFYSFTFSCSESSSMPKMLMKSCFSECLILSNKMYKNYREKMEKIALLFIHSDNFCTTVIKWQPKNFIVPKIGKHQ